MVSESSKKVSRQNAPHYQWSSVCDGWHLLRHAALSVIEERVPPGAGEVSHYHEHARQFFYILQGEALIELNNMQYRLQEGEGLHIAPGQIHRLSNDTEVELRFLVVSAPPGHGDRIMVS